MERSMSFDKNRFSSPVVVSCNGLEITNKKLYNKIILHLRKKMAKKNPRFTRQPLKNMKKEKKKKKRKSIKEIIKEPSTAVLKSSAATALTNDRGVRNLSSWVKTQLLGRGTYGSVYLATSVNDKDKTERAIKSAELLRASSLMDEGRILTRLQSPFIVRCFGDEIAREENDLHEQYNLILEYCSGQTIADLIEDNHGELLESDVKLFARDILSGLRYIHDQNIIHCDIKPENLFLCPTDHRLRANGYLTKIGDFGLAMEKGSIEYGDGTGHRRGTARYVAPETMSHGIVDFGTDVWAFGCTVLEMLTGELIWGEHGDLGFDDWVDLIGHSDCLPRIPGWLSKEAIDFLSRCLERDVHKRWSSHSLTNHPFVRL
ncbi:mitogen-activated protein kinase kinase kinase 17 [Eutrema salsugineum]|uniref:mitogen-activated protein kinase kinase kinase 17 n=1 Tax=Eutrema salsugineum TaxID=72664 RepID=UPI000CECF201|nr:mitogen-activated protein kinase kinase kinase 17 [Eutrema salsugineum]